MSTFLPWLLCLLVGLLLLLHCSPCLSDTHLRLTNTKPLPKYERVIMVLDSPKTILPEEWARDVLKWATNVALGLPADVEVAVWLCGKHTVIEQPFTLDRELLQTKIKSAKYQQGANLTDAFALATEVFRGDDRSGALILVTDGVQEDIDKVIAVQPPVPIFVAGMGSSVKLDSIKLLASSPDLGFIHPDVRLIVNHVKQTTNYNVLIKDITLLDTDKTYTELKDITHLTIRVTLLNLMAKDDIPEGTVIWFRSPLTDTVHPKRVTIETPIKPDETRSLEVKLDVKSLTSILELPCSLSFEFNTDTAKRHIPLVARHDSFQLATSFLQGLFRGWKYQEWPQSFGRDNTYRIVLFGGIGAGKSTLVNHITFALNDHYTSSPDVADACSKPGHCSTRVSTYQLTMQLLGQLFQLPIKLKDMWGVDDKNMLGDTIDMVFQGHADGRSMSDTLHRTGNERSGEEADCLLLTASIHGTSVEVLNRMKEAIKLALERGMAVLLAITYADEVDEALHEERRQSLANQFGLTLEKVIFTGYQRNGSRSCEVDRSTLHLLHRSLQAIGQSRKNLLEKYRADCQAKGNATCVAEVNRILNVADTPNVTSSTPLWSAGLCLVALAAAVAVFWSRNRGGGNDGPQADERKKAKKDKKDKKDKRKKKLREEGAALLGRKTSETGDEEEKKKEKRAEKEEKEAVKAEKLEPDEAAREEAPQRNQPAQTAQE